MIYEFNEWINLLPVCGLFHWLLDFRHGARNQQASHEIKPANGKQDIAAEMKSINLRLLKSLTSRVGTFGLNELN